MLDLPDNFFISAVPNKRELSKLFRPKELREFVFPEFGMIMYDLFWVKYTLYLIDEGYVPWAQNYLYFGAEKNGEIDVKKSVLYFSIKAYINPPKGLSSDEISVGGDFARNIGIFVTGWREKLAPILLEFSKKLRSFDFMSFVEDIFHADFKSDCVSRRIDLTGLANKQMIKSFAESKANNDAIKSVESFCLFMKILLVDKQIIKEYSRGDSAVVDPNIQFTRKVLLDGKTDISNLKLLCNTNFDFTKKEIDVLLSNLLKTDRGSYFVASIILISLLDPLRNPPRRIEQQLRQIYTIVQESVNLISQITKLFNGFAFPDRIFDQLLDVCIYWDFNFFLSDGETLARQIMKGRDLISKQEIKVGLNSKQEEQYFTSFLTNLDSDVKRKERLERLVNTLKKTDNEDTESFLLQLFRSLKAKHDSGEIFIDLLMERRTLEQYGTDQYRITGKFKDMPDATFYGISPMINWTRRILRGLV